MCNLTKETDLKHITVYKAVRKVNGRFISPFGHLFIKKGVVNKMKFTTGYRNNDVCLSNPYYGRISGFKNKSAAIYLAHELNGPVCVLKMVIGGSIWTGKGEGIISSYELDGEDIYAGTHVISYKKIYEQ